MATSWKDIVSSQQFQAETPETQKAIQADYFEKVIAPQVQANGDDMEAVRNDFLSQPLPAAAQPAQAAAAEPQAAPVDPTTLQPHEMTDEQVQQVAEKTGVRPYNGFGSSVIDAVKGAVTGGEAAKGQGAGLPTVFDAPEMSAADPQQQGDGMDSMVDHILSRMKNIGQNMTTGILGNDEDALARAKSKGAQISQDDKGNIVATFPSGSYNINPPGMDIGDVTRFAGQTAPYIAATAATGGAAALPVLGRMVATGAMDAGINLAEQAAAKTASGQNLGDIDTGETAATALTSAATAGLAPVVGKIGNAVKGALTGENTMTKSAQELINTADKVGVPLRTTEMYRAGELGEKNRVKELAHNISDIFGGPKAGAEAMNEVQNKIPLVMGNADDVAKYSDEAMVRQLAAGKQRRIAEMGNEYQDLNAQMGNQPIPIHNTIRAIDETLDKWRKPGMTVDESDIKQLIKFRDQLEAGPQDLVMLRDNRTALRQELGSAMNKQLGKNRTVKAGSDIYDAMTKDMHQGVLDNAGAHAGARLKTVDREWADFNHDLETNKVAAALKNGELNPEYVRKNISNWGSGDIDRLDSLLNADGRKTLKAAISKNLSEAAQGQDGQIAPAKFIKEYDKHKTIIAKYFSPEDVKQIEGMRNLMHTAKGMKLANSLANNGSQWVPFAIMSAAFTNPVKAGAAFVGSRAYNTKVVRNGLLRLAGAKPGSLRYNHIVRSLEHAGREEARTEEGK